MSDDVTDDGSTNTSRSSTITEIEPDHVMVKHFLYDSIMKAVHVWSILNTASKMYKELFEVYHF